MTSTHLILFDIYTLIPKECNNVDLFEGVDRIENIIQSLIELSKKKYSIGIISEDNIDVMYNHLSIDILNKCEYIFSENGIRTYDNNLLIHKESIVDYLGNNILMEIINNTNDMICNSWVSFVDQQIIIKTGQIEIHFKLSDSIDHDIRIVNHLETLLFRLKITLDKLNVVCTIRDYIIVIRPIHWDSNYCFSVIDNLLKYDKITVFRNNSVKDISSDLPNHIDEILLEKNIDVSEIIRQKFLQ